MIYLEMTSMYFINNIISPIELMKNQFKKGQMRLWETLIFQQKKKSSD